MVQATLREQVGKELDIIELLFRPTEHLDGFQPLVYG